MQQCRRCIEGTLCIGRYLDRPVIATSRIDSYSGSHVTFHYNRHEDNKLITETLPAIDFIKKIIIHIPDKRFKMIRYYGIYHPSVSRSNLVRNARLIPAIHPSKRPFLRSLSRWRLSVLASFSRPSPLFRWLYHALFIPKNQKDNA